MRAKPPRVTIQVVSVTPDWGIWVTGVGAGVEVGPGPGVLVGPGGGVLVGPGVEVGVGVGVWVGVGLGSSPPMGGVVGGVEEGVALGVVSGLGVGVLDFGGVGEGVVSGTSVGEGMGVTVGAMYWPLSEQSSEPTASQVKLPLWGATSTVLTVTLWPIAKGGTLKMPAG